MYTTSILAMYSYQMRALQQASSEICYEQTKLWSMCYDKDKFRENLLTHFKIIHVYQRYLISFHNSQSMCQIRNSFSRLSKIWEPLKGKSNQESQLGKEKILIWRITQVVDSLYFRGCCQLLFKTSITKTNSFKTYKAYVLLITIGLYNSKER